MTQLRLTFNWKFKCAALAVAALLVSGCPTPNGRGATSDTSTPMHDDGASEESHSDAVIEEKPAAVAGEYAADRPAATNDAPVNSTGPGTTDDPIKFPPLFADWPKPSVTLFFSGRQTGYIEPCGCTGLANQKGGLNRRHTLLRQMNEAGWNPVALDLGNQVRRYGRQSEIKFQTTVAGLKQLGYKGIAFGPDDLRVSAGELLAAALGSDGEPAPFVAANVKVLAPETQAPFRVIEAGGNRIGVTAVLGKELMRTISSDEIELTDPVEALTKVLPDLEAAKCDVYVLLSHASLEESTAFGKQFPLFDLIVTAGVNGEPSHRMESIEGSKARLVQVGTKGMYVSVVGVFDDEKEPLRLQRVPLDGRFGDSKEMLALMASYQQQLEAVGLEGLAIKPLPHPSGREFVGSAACADCHEREYEVWKKTPHAHATDSIVHPGERSDIPRHHDPECLSCHVTGWNPQEYYPYKSGYLSLEATKHMAQMGCENCHGPGSEHVAAELGEIADLTDEMQQSLREQMVLKLDTAKQTCLECHDLDNSPAFHVEGAFEKYWERIKH